MFCVAAKHGKGRTNLTKPLQMYIKFLNYAPKKIIFKINLIINPLCIQLNMSILYKCFRYNCSNRNLYLTLPENFRENINLNTHKRVVYKNAIYKYLRKFEFVSNTKKHSEILLTLHKNVYIKEQQIHFINGM